MTTPRPSPRRKPGSRAASATLEARGPSLRWGDDCTEAGLTLVEMLVVLAIIGIAAGATALGIGSATRAPSTEAEARRLATAVQEAADDAMVTDAGVALDWDEGGWRILKTDGGGAPRHDLPGGATLTVAGARRPAPLGVDGTGLPFRAVIARGGERWAIGYDGLKAVATRVSPS